MQGMKEYTRLSQAEREQIFLLLHEGRSLREIGKRLGRQHTTISRELVRQRVDAYSPVLAEQEAAHRRHQRRRHKLDDPLLCSFVIRRLGDGWSPEQIAGRLRRIGSQQTFCHETLYWALYQKPLKGERLWEFLRCGHKKRERSFDRRTRHARQTLIADRRPITERPEEAQLRSKVGHWETDLMEGRRTTGQVISVTVDRRSGALMLDKLMTKESRDKMDALIGRMGTIPLSIRKTMTFDNGPENTQHRRLESLRIFTYFCAAYRSWEKGTVENTIGLVRQYVPKGGDLATVTQQELMIISQALNDRPRKRLGYLTPNEVLLKEAGWCVTS